MGNDIEIKDLDVRSTSFLPREIKDVGGITEIYNLEEEFAKTKQNKNLLLYLSILLFFAVVVACALAFTIYVQDKNKSVDINISEFEDLRLKEVIDSARSHENNLDLLLIKLEILKVEQQKKILEVRQKYYRQELNTLDREYSTKETNRRLSNIRKSEKGEIAAINRTYKNQILEKENEIEKTKEEIAAKEATKTETKSSSVSNVDKLNALKMEELKKSNDSGVVSLREYYDAYVKYLTDLYNPKIGSKKINTIIRSKTTAKSKSVEGYHPIYQSEGIITPGEYEAVHNKLAESDILMNRVMRIPYQNSVVPVLKKIDTISTSVESDYESMLKRFAAVIQYKNAVIDQYQSAVGYTLADKAESGYIINADDGKNLHVHLKKIFRDPVNSTALVFRGDDEYIGTIKIKSIDRDNVIRAEIVALAQNESVKPFDKLLLAIK